MARTIEAQTAKLPSDTFLWASLGAIATSLVLQTLGKKAESLFIGQWAPTFLILGLYNKIVKELGSDAHERAALGNGSLTPPSRVADRRSPRTRRPCPCQSGGTAGRTHHRQ